MLSAVRSRPGQGPALGDPRSSGWQHLLCLQLHLCYGLDCRRPVVRHLPYTFYPQAFGKRGSQGCCHGRFGARQVTEGKLTAGSLSTFVIYALYVGTNTGAVAQVVSQLIQVQPSLKHDTSLSPRHGSTPRCLLYS